MRAIATAVAFVGLVALALFGAFMWWGDSVRQDRLYAPVKMLRVGEIIYLSEAGEGGGPGANESGIRVFAMPQALSDALLSDGISHLQRVAPAARPNEAFPPDWHETPVSTATGEWPRSSFGLQPQIEDIVFRYRVDAAIDQGVLTSINEALATDGSFYALESGRLFVLIPSTRRVVYAFGG